MAIGTSGGQYFDSAMDYQMAQTSGPEWRIDDFDRTTGGDLPIKRFVIPTPPKSDTSQDKSFKEKMNRIQDHDQKDIEQQLNDPNYVPLPEVPLRVNPGTPSGFQSGRVISDAGKNVHIVRHGTTGKEDQIRGWSDMPLSDEGHEEAQHTARALSDSGIDLIHHSDLERARQTAEHIGNATGAELVPNPKLRTWNTGELTGTSSQKSFPQLAEYAKNKPDEPLPGGESFNQFKTRFFQGMQEALDHAGDRKLAVVTHGRGERLLNAWSDAGQGSDIDMKTFLDQGHEPGSVQIMHVADRFGHGSDMEGPYSPRGKDYDDWAKDYTPPKGNKDWEALPEDDRKGLMWDTPIPSQKDPALHKGTPNQLFNAVDDLLGSTDEDMKKQYEGIKKQGITPVPDSPLPSGRIRLRKDLPAVQEYMKRLPEDIDMYDLEDGTVIFKKKPTPASALTS